MQGSHSINAPLPPELAMLYSEQLNAKSSWFILNPESNQIILHSHSFDKLFQCECNHHDLSLDSLPITPKSYNDLMNEINYIITSNQSTKNLVILESQCGKSIPIWLSLQPIIVNGVQVAILVNTERLDTPDYLTTMLKQQSINQLWATMTTASDYDMKLKQIQSEYELDSNHPRYNNNHDYKFSITEQSILNLVLAGLSQKELCHKLNLSRTRVTQYISQICHKCGHTGYSGKYLKQHFNTNTIM
jgi:DNA-binding CsgD family transcriptional regulator